MYWLITWIDEENFCREKRFDISTAATRFAAELLSHFPDCLMSLTTVEELTELPERVHTKPLETEEPFDPYDPGDERFQAGLDGSSRCGNWPASIGEMAWAEKDKMKA